MTRAGRAGAAGIAQPVHIARTLQAALYRLAARLGGRGRPARCCPKADPTWRLVLAALRRR